VSTLSPDVHVVSWTILTHKQSDGFKVTAKRRDKTKFEGAMVASPTGKQDKYLQESYLIDLKDYIMYWAGDWYEHLNGGATGALEDFAGNPLLVITTSYRVSHWANAAICQKAEPKANPPDASLIRPDLSRKFWEWEPSWEISVHAGNAEDQGEGGSVRRSEYCVAISGFKIHTPKAMLKASRISLQRQSSSSRVSLNSMKSGLSRLTHPFRSRRNT